MNTNMAGFRNFLRPCTLDVGNLNIGRVKYFVMGSFLVCILSVSKAAFDRTPLTDVFSFAPPRICWKKEFIECCREGSSCP